jgi:hypothetical protein
MAEPYVPIAELAAPTASLTAVTTVVNNNLTIANNVIVDRNAAQASELITEQKLALVIHPLLLGGA